MHFRPHPTSFASLDCQARSPLVAPLPRGYRRWVWVVPILLGLAHSLPAQSTDIDVEAGFSWVKGQRLTPTVFTTALGQEHRLGALRWQPQVDVGMVRSRHSAFANLDRTVWIAAAGARFPHLWKNAFFSFQLAAVAPHTGALSSTQQFVSSLGWKQGRVTVMVRHISNGGTHEPNYGESMLLFGVSL